MKSLKVGIIGAGSIVLQRHIPGLRNIPGIEIAAVANSRLSSAEAFCARHAPEARPIEHWQDLVALPDLDIVWIGTAPFLHKETTVAALAVGKHVFCQARMAMNLAEAKEMLSAAQARPDLVTMLCPPPHGMRGNRLVHRLLAGKQIGDIRDLRLQNLNSAFLDPAKPAHWRQRVEISGSNIMTLGIHTEVLQRWFGDFRVTAAQGRVFIPHRDGYEVKIPDILQVQIAFENGALGQMEFSGLRPGKSVELLEVTGTTGILRYDYETDAVSIQRPGGADWESIPIPSDLEDTWQVESDFIHAVRHPSEPRPHPDFQDGVRYMRVVEQVNDLL